MSDRARVLYLTPGGHLQGGAQVQYRYLIEGLQGTRYEPVVVCPAGGELHDALAASGVFGSVIPHPSWSRGEVLRWRHRLWIERRRAPDRLIAFARAQEPDLVHGDLVVAPYLDAISASLGIPSIVHVRGPLKPRWVRRLRLRNAAALIAIGGAYRDDLVRCSVPADRIAVVEDATDPSRFHPRNRTSLGEEASPLRDEGDVVFGIVGRIEPFKRQLDFLRAAEAIVRSGRRARFVLIGAPNRNRPCYVRRVLAFPSARGIERRVSFTGPRRDMERVMASLDVLVTLSGGSVMLEAMASGIPVVTASARSPDLLRIVRDGESGRVVPARDPRALVRVMLELCDDADQRRRLGAQGRRRAEALFGRERLVDETVLLYDTLLAARGRAPDSCRQCGR